jgi:hypothetical protein
VADMYCGVALLQYTEIYAIRLTIFMWLVKITIATDYCRLVANSMYSAAGYQLDPLSTGT